MSTKFFNFNNEASDITIDVNDETGVVSIPALNEELTYESIDAFSEEFAVSRGIQSEDLKNWTLISNLDTYYFVQKKATGGLDTEETSSEESSSEETSKYIPLVRSLVEDGATQLEIIQMLQKENVSLEDIIDIYKSATTVSDTDTEDTDTEVDQKTELATAVIDNFINSPINDLSYSTSKKLKKLWFINEFNLDKTIDDLTVTDMIDVLKDTFELEDINNIKFEKQEELETQIQEISEQFKDNVELLDLNKGFLESKLDNLSMESILLDKLMESVNEYIDIYTNITKTTGLPKEFINAVYGIDPKTFESAISDYERALIMSQISGKQHGVPIANVSIDNSALKNVSIEHMTEPSEFVDIIKVNDVYIGIKELTEPTYLLKISMEE